MASQYAKMQPPPPPHHQQQQDHFKQPTSKHPISVLAHAKPAIINPNNIDTPEQLSDRLNSALARNLLNGSTSLKGSRQNGDICKELGDPILRKAGKGFVEDDLAVDKQNAANQMRQAAVLAASAASQQQQKQKRLSASERLAMGRPKPILSATNSSSCVDTSERLKSLVADLGPQHQAHSLPSLPRTQPPPPPLPVHRPQAPPPPPHQQARQQQQQQQKPPTQPKPVQMPTLETLLAVQRQLQRHTRQNLSNSMPQESMVNNFLGDKSEQSADQTRQIQQQQQQQLCKVGNNFLDTYEKELPPLPESISSSVCTTTDESQLNSLESQSSPATSLVSLPPPPPPISSYLQQYDEVTSRHSNNSTPQSQTTATSSSCSTSGSSEVCSIKQFPIPPIKLQHQQASQQHTSADLPPPPLLHSSSPNTTTSIRNIESGLTLHRKSISLANNNTNNCSSLGFHQNSRLSPPVVPPREVGVVSASSLKSPHQQQQPMKPSQSTPMPPPPLPPSAPPATLPPNQPLAATSHKPPIAPRPPLHTFPAPLPPPIPASCRSEQISNDHQQTIKQQQQLSQQESKKQQQKMLVQRGSSQVPSYDNYDQMPNCERSSANETGHTVVNDNDLIKQQQQQINYQRHLFAPNFRQAPTGANCPPTAQSVSSISQRSCQESLSSASFSTTANSPIEAAASSALVTSSALIKPAPTSSNSAVNTAANDHHHQHQSSALSTGATTTNSISGDINKDNGNNCGQQRFSPPVSQLYGQSEASSNAEQQQQQQPSSACTVGFDEPDCGSIRFPSPPPPELLFEELEELALLEKKRAAEAEATEGGDDYDDEQDDDFQCRLPNSAHNCMSTASFQQFTTTSAPQSHLQPSAEFQIPSFGKTNCQYSLPSPSNSNDSPTRPQHQQKPAGAQPQPPPLFRHDNQPGNLTVRIDETPAPLKSGGLLSKANDGHQSAAANRPNGRQQEPQAQQQQQIQQAQRVEKSSDEESTLAANHRIMMSMVAGVHHHHHSSSSPSSSSDGDNHSSNSSSSTSGVHSSIDSPISTSSKSKSNAAIISCGAKLVMEKRHLNQQQQLSLDEDDEEDFDNYKQKLKQQFASAVAANFASNQNNNINQIQHTGANNNHSHDHNNNNNAKHFPQPQNHPASRRLLSSSTSSSSALLTSIRQQPSLGQHQRRLNSNSSLSSLGSTIAANNNGAGVTNGALRCKIGGATSAVAAAAPVKPALKQKKTVSFSDKIELVACADEELEAHLPNPLLARVLAGKMQ